jgi:hypothetical protein
MYVGKEAKLYSEVKKGKKLSINPPIEVVKIS